MRKLQATVLAILAAGFLSSSILTGCDQGGEEIVVEPFVVTLPVEPATVSAVAGTGFTFGTGAMFAPALAGENTTVTFTSTSSFNIQSAGGTASGALSFGSCIFEITSSTIPGLSAPQTIEIQPCTIDVEAEDGLGSGGQSGVNATLTLGDEDSDQAPFGVDVQVNGTDVTVSVNGETLFTAKVNEDGHIERDSIHTTSGQSGTGGAGTVG